jgi:hypothetical protein
MAPIDAIVYEIERFRCDTCGKVFAAEIPQGVGEEKYEAVVETPFSWGLVESEATQRLA